MSDEQRRDTDTRSDIGNKDEKNGEMSKQESGWTNRPTLDIDEPAGTTILQATNAANTMKRSGKRQ